MNPPETVVFQKRMQIVHMGKLLVKVAGEQLHEY